MKKKLVFVISLYILIFILALVAYSNYLEEKRSLVTGETVTGEAASSNFAVSVSVGEEAAEAAAPSGGGGGAAKKSFNINPEEINVKLRHGETTTNNVTITNNGNQRLSMSMEETPSLAEFLKISEESFSLGPGESKVVILDFIAREETIPNLYLGKIIVKGDGIEKEILVSVEIETKAPLFDVGINLPERFMWSLPGDEIYYIVELFNLGDAEKQVDVFVEYKLIDSNGNEILSDSESIAVIGKTSYAKELKIPEYTEFGRYVIYVKTTYSGEVASASVWFNVGRKPFFYVGFALIVLFLVALIIVIIMIIRKVNRKVPVYIPYPGNPRYLPYS